MVEQVICNHQVGGSIPLASSTPNTRGEVLKRSTRADCKSVGYCLRRFESFPPHPSSIHTRQCAGVAQLVEHWPSKPIVAGSSPVSRLVAQLLRTLRLCGETYQNRASESGCNAVVRCMANNSSERCRRWLNWHDWKSCVQATVPWVRIPLSPPNVTSASERKSDDRASGRSLCSRSKPKNFPFIFLCGSPQTPPPLLGLQNPLNPI